MRKKAVEGDAVPDPPIKNLPRTAGVAWGGEDKKGATANKPQKRHYGKANPLVEMKGSTGANAREKLSCQKPPAS